MGRERESGIFSNQFIEIEKEYKFCFSFPLTKDSFFLP